MKERADLSDTEHLRNAGLLQKAISSGAISKDGMSAGMVAAAGAGVHEFNKYLKDNATEAEAFFGKGGILSTSIDN